MKAVCILALLSFVALAPAARAAELRLGYIDLELRPFLTGEGATVPAQPGMAVELLQRCIKRVGGTLQLTRMPLRRLIEEVRAGRQDGILGYRYAADRAVDLVYPMRGGGLDSSRHVVPLAYSIYRRQGDAIGWDGHSLTGLNNPVAVTASALIADTLQSRGVDIVRVENNAQMFGMLALGRVDALVTLDIAGDRLLREQDNRQVEKLSPPLVAEEFYVPVSQAFYAANRDFTERLWQVLGESRDATYAELTPGYLF
jgi:polar amino acid transport system substrate-binding protein